MCLCVSLCVCVRVREMRRVLFFIISVSMLNRLCVFYTILIFSDVYCE